MDDLEAFFEQEAQRELYTTENSRALADVEEYMRRNGLLYEPEAYAQQAARLEAAEDMADALPVAQWIAAQPDYFPKDSDTEGFSLLEGPPELLDEIMGGIDDEAEYAEETADEIEGGTEDEEPAIMDEEGREELAEFIDLMETLAKASSKDFASKLEEVVIAHLMGKKVYKYPDFLGILNGFVVSNVRQRLQKLEMARGLITKRVSTVVAGNRLIGMGFGSRPHDNEYRVDRKHLLEVDLVFMQPENDRLLPMIDALLPEGGSLDVTTMDSLIAERNRNEADALVDMQIAKSIVEFWGGVFKKAFSIERGEDIGITDDRAKLSVGLVDLILQTRHSGKLEYNEELLERAKKFGISADDLKMFVDTHMQIKRKINGKEEE